MIFTVLCLLAASPEARSTPLPLRSLVLYENGVGYFERRGQVRAGQVAEIPLEPGQLDDALKSLVVMSGRGVASVDFAPPLALEAARALAGLPNAEEQHSMLAMLRALKGVEVQVQKLDGSSVRGRVLEISDDEKLADKEGKPIDDPVLMVFGEGGLTKTPLRTIGGVRPLEGSVSRAWSRAAATMAQQPEPERLVVRGAAGAGEVAVGYTTEAPVWRTTYRLVVRKSGARLQGYALVHNDTDEAWSGVRLTLASGRPTSFLFPLAGPRYGRRDLVSPEDGLANAPQLPGREALEHLRGTMSGEAHGAGGIGLLGVGTVGYGSGSGSVGHPSSAKYSEGVGSTLLDEGPTPLEAAAVSEAGDLFLYTVKEPVVLGARRSALLPIVDSPTSAERVTLIDANGEAFSGLRLQNDTPLTLEGGTLSVFIDGAYGGETQIDRVKPGEVRVVKHGVDLDVEVGRSSSSAPGGVKRVSLSLGMLSLKRVDVITHQLTLRSRADVQRTLLVELPARQFRLTVGAEEDVRSPEQPRYARLTLEAHGDTTMELVEAGAVEERLALSGLSVEKVTALLQTASPTLPEGERAQLERVKVTLVQAETEFTRAASMRERLTRLNGEIDELRQSLTAVGKAGAVDAAKTLGQRVVALEAERAALRASETQASQRADDHRKALVVSLAAVPIMRR